MARGEPFWIVSTYADNGKLLNQSMHTEYPGVPRVEVHRIDPPPPILRPEDADPIYDDDWYDRGSGF